VGRAHSSHLDRKGSEKAAGEHDDFVCTQYLLAMIGTSWTEVTGPTSLACSQIVTYLFGK
jgi:hypothetical protein